MVSDTRCPAVCMNINLSEEVPKGKQFWGLPFVQRGRVEAVKRLYALRRGKGSFRA